MIIRLRRAWPLSLVVGFVSVSLWGQQQNQALIRRYSQEAGQAMAAKNAGAAAAALEALAKLTPKDPRVDANLGTVYYMQGRYGPAADRLKKALQLDPQMPGVKPLLGICDAELSHFQEAIPLLDPAFRRPPNEQVGRLIGIELMEAYHSTRNDGGALAVSEELLKRYPNDPEILYRAGHLYGDRALEVMSALVRAAPDSPWERMAFAEALDGQKKYALAIIEYRKVLAADPQMPGVHYRLGRALLMNATDDRPAQEEALGEFHLALEEDPRNAAAEYEIGQIYQRRGQVGQAAQHFSRSVEIDPRNGEGQVALASALLTLGKPAAAFPHLARAVQIDPQNPSAHYLLARVCLSQSNKPCYQREMALYQKYRAQPSFDGGGEEP